MKEENLIVKENAVADTNANPVIRGRKKRVHVYEEDARRIVELAKEGKTARAIASILDVTTQTVGRHLRRSGLDFNELRRERASRNRERLVEMVRSGIKLREAAEKLGVRYATASSWCSRLNVGKTRRLTDLQKRKLLKLVGEDGMTVKDAAKSARARYDAACRFCRLQGLTSPETTRMENLRRCRRKSHAAAAVEMLRKGYSIRRVSESLGLSTNYVHILREKELGIGKAIWEDGVDRGIDRLFSIEGELRQHCSACGSKNDGRACGECRIAKILDSFKEGSRLA